MKNLFKNLLMLTAIASLGLMFGCNEDEEEIPVVPMVSFESSVLDDTGSATLKPGDVLSFVITVDAPAGFNTLNMDYFRDGVAESDSVISKTPGTTPLEYTSDQFSFEISNEDVGIVHTFVFGAVDELGQASSSLTLTIDVSSPDARSYSAVLLVPPLGDTRETKTSETFYSTSVGETYSMTEVLTSANPISADIDFGYFYGASTGATLSDPASYPFAYGQVDWGTLNSTTFKRTTLTALTEVVTWADLDAAFEAATDADSDPGIESGLEIGEVLAFETDGDKEGGAKRGLILVVNYSGEGTSVGKIELDILVQEVATP